MVFWKKIVAALLVCTVTGASQKEFGERAGRW